MSETIVEVAEGVFEPLTVENIHAAAQLAADRMFPRELSEADYHRYVGEYLVKEALAEGSIRPWQVTL